MSNRNRNRFKRIGNFIQKMNFDEDACSYKVTKLGHQKLNVGPDEYQKPSIH